MKEKVSVSEICICGGGSLGHVIAGFLSATTSLKVNVLTSRPLAWSDSLTINTIDGKQLDGKLHKVSADPAEVVSPAQVVLLCLPGTAIRQELEKIKAAVRPGTFVGSVFCSTGFFFEALDVLPEDVFLWGFQRVPFIARTEEYGHSANLLGYKSELKIAVERCSEAEKTNFCTFIEMAFNTSTELLGNYLEASLTNSNPLLHTSRLYTMFGEWREGVTYPRQSHFYAEWTDEAAALYIAMDKELFRLLDALPVTKGFLAPVLEYYESHDAHSLCEKLSSIPSFKPILSPMKDLAEGAWVPDFDSRYFIEDFGFSLRYIYELCAKHDIDAPHINKVYHWGVSVINQYSKTTL